MSDAELIGWWLVGMLFGAGVAACLIALYVDRWGKP